MAALNPRWFEPKTRFAVWFCASYCWMMQLELPDDLPQGLRREDLLLDLAVGMYASGRISLGRAAGVAELSQPEFQKELGRRRVPLNYSMDDLAHDLAAAEVLAGDDRRQ